MRQRLIFNGRSPEPSMQAAASLVTGVVAQHGHQDVERRSGGTVAGMNLNKLLCGISLLIGLLVALAFLVDLAAGIPFGRFDIVTDIIMIVAGGLIVWQGVETWMDL